MHDTLLNGTLSRPGIESEGIQEREVADRSICIFAPRSAALLGSMPGEASPGIVANSQTDP
jgi:hypothetical protein